MGTIKYPQIDLYWKSGYKFDRIATEMSKNRFRTLRLALHYRDVSITPEGEGIFWKILPILNCVKKRCNEIERNIEQYSVDEQVIPFTGRCPARQFIRNKPRPVGVKNFVVATSKGLIMDFELYQGKFTILDDKSMGLGSAIVLKLLKTIPPGSFIFFDRFFTSIPLLKKLQDLNFSAIGTINNNRIKGVTFKSDSQMKRGDSQEFCYDDGQYRISVVKWKDTKCVTAASTVAGVTPMGKVKRWSKQDRKFIEIDCPLAFVEYNKYMGGVDICDQSMEYYRTFLKTNKWTVKLAQHFIDLAVVNSWNEYRRECEMFSKVFNQPVKPMPLLDFRLNLGETLLSSIVTIEEQDSSDDDDTIIPRKILKLQPKPNETKRYDGFKHFPIWENLNTARCCRYENCKARTRCKCEKCDMFLCLSKAKNCFKQFHMKP